MATTFPPIIQKQGWIHLESWTENVNLIHGWTTRPLGDMSDELILRTALEKLQLSADQVAGAEQVHGNRIAVLDKSHLGQRIPGADGLITCERGVFVFVKTADCLPVLMMDRRLRGVGAIHAGWRSVLDGIIDEAVSTWKSLGLPLADLEVALGPHIGLCCFEVRDEVAERMLSLYPEAVEVRDNRVYADLSSMVAEQFRQQGLSAEQVNTLGRCTSCETSNFFSYRREGPRRGSQVAVIGLR